MVADTVEKFTQEELELLEILNDPVLWAQVELGEEPRWYQAEILRDPSKRKAVRCGRRVGKCIWRLSEIETEDGPMTAEELYKLAPERRPAILTCDESSLTITKTANYSIFDNSIKPVYKITTNTGRVNYATENHPYLTINNNETSWVCIQDMKLGDHIAVPASYEGLINGIPIGTETAAALGMSFSGNKAVPKSVMSGTSADIASFLAAYWHNNGWNSGKTYGCGTDSYRAAKDIQHLLLRVGMVSHIENTGAAGWYVIIDDPECIYKQSRSVSPGILWDQVVCIEYIGEQQTYDLTVEETHTFISDDIISHNTWTMCTHMLWFAYTHANSEQLVVAPYEAQIAVIFDQLRTLINKSDHLVNSLAGSKRSPQEIRLKNGAKIKGFTAGTKSGAEAGSIRGQRADWIYMDEVDYMTDKDFEAVYAIAIESPEIGVWVSSTPTGRRGKFYHICTDPDSVWREFHYPAMVNPLWTDSMEQELRRTFSQVGYEHDVLAEFGTEMVGVFPKDKVDAARTKYNYVTHRPPQASHVCIGVDWDKYGAASQIVVTGWIPNKNKPDTGKFRVLDREEIPKSQFTLTEAVNKVVELNAAFNPDFIYIDRGMGEYQLETFHIYGMEHPETCLNNRLKGIQFSETKEFIDPFTKLPDKKPIKVFMVNHTQILLEEGLVEINDSDEILWRQLCDYQVTKITDRGLPKYTSENEHALDAMMLSLLAFALEIPELTDIIVQPSFKAPVHTIKLKHPNIFRGSVSQPRNYHDQNDYGEKEFEKMVEVPLGTTSYRVQQKFKKRMVGWSDRGGYGNPMPKRRTW